MVTITRRNICLYILLIEAIFILFCSLFVLHFIRGIEVIYRTSVYMDLLVVEVRSYTNL
jgi:hypothetical protein